MVPCISESTVFVNCFMLLRMLALCRTRLISRLKLLKYLRMKVARTDSLKFSKNFSFEHYTFCHVLLILQNATRHRVLFFDC